MSFIEQLTNAQIARLLRIAADQIENNNRQMHVHHYEQEYRGNREDLFDFIPGHALRHQVIGNNIVRFAITVDERTDG